MCQLNYTHFSKNNNHMYNKEQQEKCVLIIVEICPFYEQIVIKGVILFELWDIKLPIKPYFLHISTRHEIH